MAIGAFALLALTVYALTNFVKFARAGDWNAVITNGLAFVMAMVAVFGVSASDVGPLLNFSVTRDQKVVLDISLQSMNVYTKLIVSLLISSGGISFAQYLKAKDNSDSASTPSLLPGAVKVVDLEDGSVIKPSRRRRKTPPPTNL